MKIKIGCCGFPIPLYGFFRPTDVVIEAWNETAEIAKSLAAAMVVFQCPASFRPTRESIANMRGFFKAIDRRNLSFAWEPRGDWPDQVVESLCQEFDLIHCVDPFARLPVTEKLAYFRLHGGPGYRHKYTDNELNKVIEICQKYSEAYVLFNNLSMLDDAHRLQNRIKKKGSE